MDLKVDLKKMEVWEEEIVEVLDRGLLLVVEEKTDVEDKVAYKVVKIGVMIVELDTKVVASMFDVVVVCWVGNFGAIVDKVGVVDNLHIMDLG